MIWLVMANSNMYRIYQFEKRPFKITLLKEIDHPENKSKRKDLTSDKQGHYKTDSSARGSYSPHSDPKEVEFDRFSKEIANELNIGRNANAYQNLIIVMTPHMMGLLYKNLDKHVENLIIKTIQKDILLLSQKELLDFLRDEIF